MLRTPYRAKYFRVGLIRGSARHPNFMSALGDGAAEAALGVSELPSASAAPDVETNALRFMPASIHKIPILAKSWQALPSPSNRSAGERAASKIQIGRINCFYWKCVARDAYNRPQSGPVAAALKRSFDMRSRFRQFHSLEPPGHTNAHEAKLIGLESAVEDLGLSVRTRNALRAIGCDTVEDVLELDLSASVRGLGRKTGRRAPRARWSAQGFPHPALQDQPGVGDPRYGAQPGTYAGPHRNGTGSGRQGGPHSEAAPSQSWFAARQLDECAGRRRA